MDRIGLEILERELAADCQVLADAATKASHRVKETHPGHLEACAYEVARFYTVFERMLENVCTAFENHFARHGDWHEKLLSRLALELPGLRPALLPADAAARLRELKRFRHLIRHAYDLTLREDRLRELVAITTEVSRLTPTWCKTFIETVRREQNW
jgi:hypothetical protein